MDISTGSKTVNVYAQWTPNTLTVNYSPECSPTTPAVIIKNKGTVVTAMQSQTLNYNTTNNNGLYNGNNVNSYNITKEGHKFNGKGWYYKNIFIDWNTAYSGKTLAEALGVDISTESKTVDVCAKWEIILYDYVIRKVYKDAEGKFNKVKGTTTFALYEDSKCEGTNSKLISVTGGQKTIQLKRGTYYLKETVAPVGYNIDETNNCHKIVVTSDVSTNLINVENESTCNSKLEEHKKQYSSNSSEYKLGLIDLYGEYKLNNLLNFRNPSCTDNSECYESKIDCLSGSNTRKDMMKNFNSENYSCYNNVIKDGNNNITAFCSISLEFDSKLKQKDGFYSDVKAGQLIMSDNINSSILSINLNNLCYFINNNTNEKEQSSLNVPSVNLGSNSLIQNTSTNVNYFLEKRDADMYEGEITVEYSLPDVYAKKGNGSLLDKDGKPYTSSCWDCKYLGKGIASLFNQGTGTLSFGYNMEIDDPLSNAKEISVQKSNACPYKITKEIIQYDENELGEIQLEFRVIDTNKPFDRKTNSNWSDKTDDTIDNNKVKQYITNEDINNSYNKTNEGSLYSNQTKENKTIILTPDLIKQIREYNIENSYDEYKYACDEHEKNCVNAFFKKFNIIKTN